MSVNGDFGSAIGLSFNATGTVEINTGTFARAAGVGGPVVQPGFLLHIDGVVTFLGLATASGSIEISITNSAFVLAFDVSINLGPFSLRATGFAGVYYDAHPGLVLRLAISIDISIADIIKITADGELQLNTIDRAQRVDDDERRHDERADRRQVVPARPERRREHPRGDQVQHALPDPDRRRQRHGRRERRDACDLLPRPERLGDRLQRAAGLLRPGEAGRARLDQLAGALRHQAHGRPDARLVELRPPRRLHLPRLPARGSRSRASRASRPTTSASSSRPRSTSTSSASRSGASGSTPASRRSATAWST